MSSCFPSREKRLFQVRGSSFQELRKESAIQFERELTSEFVLEDLGQLFYGMTDTSQSGYGYRFYLAEV
jgi:hypothetical protein